jgi:flagellar basal body-associated protein FliL
MKTRFILLALSLMVLTITASAQTVDTLAQQRKFADALQQAQGQEASLQSILLPGDTLVVNAQSGRPRPQVMVFKLVLTSAQKSSYTAELQAIQADILSYSDSLKKYLP